ncbi:MAG TPA: adenylate/guanylate cyclase domain-containing protein [Mycobacteriales bacterium]|nr:adenylate/guanylate cyclase domain-containing protein [Mycobacteriales bacterium]
MDTVVLVLTDVQGSTRLWQDEPAEMDRAMTRHHEIVHGAVAEHGGWRPVDQGEGDAVFAAFASATAAVAAAAQVQRDLTAEPWPTSVPLRVRIGVHVGEVRERGGNLYGDPVNRCARLRGLGAGGQTLLSAPVFELVRDKLPAGASVTDLGEHRMKDLVRSEHVWQLDVDGLQREFPPLSSLDRVLHNLPVQRSALIGREEDLARVLAAMDGHRLVTLTGFGGMGKTRLALQAAAELAVGDGDGVWFVDLASTTDPAAVPGVVGQATGLGGSDADSVIHAMAGQRLLLVLDNLEQVMGCVSFVSDILDRVPEVAVLATSREPLRLAGERELPLAPLALPSADASQDAAAVSTSAAVQLLIDRAVAVRPDFRVTDDNAAAVAAICERLDGHPLAIELAAARLRMMTPQALLPRLDSALTVLTGGRRDMPGRQQTLRAAIAWSYELLNEEERQLLDRMSVFAGPVGFADVEAVCGDGLDVLSALASLVEKSLVRDVPGEDDEDRYGLLVSIRAYAAEQLAAAGETKTLRDRHAAHVTEQVALRPPYDPAEYKARRARVRDLYDELGLAWSHVQLASDETRLQAFPNVWFNEVFERTQDSTALDTLLEVSRIPNRQLVQALAEKAYQHQSMSHPVPPALMDRLFTVAAAVGSPEARLWALCHGFQDLTPQQRRDWVAEMDEQLLLVPPDSPWSRDELTVQRDNMAAVLLQFVDPELALAAATRNHAGGTLGMLATRNLAISQSNLGRWQEVLETAAPIIAAGVARQDFVAAHVTVAAAGRAMVQLGHAQEALDVLEPWTVEADRRGWQLPRELSVASAAFALCELGRADEAVALFADLTHPLAHPMSRVMSLRVERLSGIDSDSRPADELVRELHPRAWTVLTHYLAAVVELALRTTSGEERRAVLARLDEFDRLVVLGYGYQADLDALLAAAAER